MNIVLVLPVLPSTADIQLHGACCTISSRDAVACGEPLHSTVWPVNTSVLEQPSLSVTVTATRWRPALAYT